MKSAVSLARVTHTHTHTHTDSLLIEYKKIKSIRLFLYVYFCNVKIHIKKWSFCCVTIERKF